MNLCKCARKILFFTIFCLATVVHAQPVPSIDLAYRAELVPAPPYQIGQPFKLRNIVTNNSTQFFTYAIIEPIAGIPPNIAPFDLVTSFGGITNCGICLSGMCYETPVIGPGETVVCEAGGKAVASFLNPVRLRARVFHPFNIATDPNPANNEDQVSVAIMPEPIVSVPLSRHSYGLMALLLLAFGTLAARKS